MNEVDDRTYQTEVVEASSVQPVLVDFWGPRCMPCLQMMPWVEQMAKEQADVLKVVKVNTAENRRFSMHLKVMGLPTFVLYRDGLEAERLTGDACRPETILAMLQRHAVIQKPA